jgi:hypothetical protein
MHTVNKKMIVEGLRELSDRAEQRRLWLSTGGEVSSFTEAVEGLYTDSGLTFALERRTTGLGTMAEDALLDLSAALRKVDRRLDPETLIETEAMARVRRLAESALSLLERA